MLQLTTDSGLLYFATVQVNLKFCTIVWDNGADLDSDVLYSIVSAQPIPNYNQLIKPNRDR